MTSHWKHAIVSLVGMSLALVSCDSGDDANANRDANGNGNGGGSESESAPADEPTEIEPVWTEDLEVVSGPRQAGDVALVYVTEDRDLYLVGVDIDSGEELWRQAASPGEVVTGIAVVPHVIDGHPVYFRPSDVDNLYAELVVADPDTGEDVVVTDPYLFRSTPQACHDVDGAICLRVADDYDDATEWRRLDIDGDGSLITDEALDARPGRELHSPGLLDVTEDDTEYLAVYEDGTQLWRREVSELFGDGYSADEGWSWSYDERTDLFTGRLEPEANRDGDRSVYDLERYKVIAIERATGEVAWEDEGVMHLCHNTLDVPTDEERELAASGEDVSLHPVPVRCRVQGTVITQDGEEDPQREGIDVTLEGYEPQTGETTWSLDLGAERSLIGWYGGSEPVTMLDRTSALVSVQGEPTIVDLRNGETRAPGDETMWCTVSDSHMFEYREPYYFDGEPSHQRIGESLHQWCDASADSVDESGPAPTGVPNAFGVRSGDRAVVATPDGLVGYDTAG